MILTKHAKARQRQRGMPDFLLNIIEQTGRSERAPGDAKYFLVSGNTKEQLST